jgi:hypothetical protein
VHQRHVVAADVAHVHIVGEEEAHTRLRGTGRSVGSLWISQRPQRLEKVRVATISRVEVIDGEISATAANQAALRRALEYAGVEFIDENGGGVRLRKPGDKGPKVR